MPQCHLILDMSKTSLVQAPQNPPPSTASMQTEKARRGLQWPISRESSSSSSSSRTTTARSSSRPFPTWPTCSEATRLRSERCYYQKSITTNGVNVWSWSKVGARLSIFLALRECAKSVKTKILRFTTFVAYPEKGLIDYLN